MATKQDIRRYLVSWDDELNSVTLYGLLAEQESNPRIAGIYRHLAQVEQQHADLWAKKIRDAGGTLPKFRTSWRTRLLGWMAQRFGIDMVLPTVASMEDIDSRDYGKDSGEGKMAKVERSHAQVLRQLGRSTHGGVEGSALAQIEGRHRTAGGNALRAAVLGAEDGLVSNLSLVMGVAGAALSSTSILLTGLAGMLAGAISMALGEWVSVQSSRELYQKQIATEKEEIETMPEEEIEELSLIYQARGLEEAEARRIATQIMSNKETALDTLVRDELGLDPKELGGSAWEAAITSFFLFALGAVFPVIPFTFLQGTHAIVVSALFSSVGLFVIGAAITLFTGRSVFSSGMRQVGFGLAAAAVTFGVGRLIGVTVAG
jgi:VIT1/CCC1 family predicted Fe2+/Mn2+ transporter